ncbi:MAG: ATP-binding cassette domain-containing protein [Alphaproteobacteria bacterium]|nr:ATP-binding cassette domain-containing protein [Rhizobiaceae bacterium]MBU3961779.1 ATP-binding cassette domain-containing protein [Alphaproteobacteria bacterium]MBU4051784.1 ATP-binding cassette domain-containing protein [Alphaproteobacteria bacterium]MBU4090091.1 ATP-binding cassette domain-containing protein [Alphaproteobacteria bacterium]MBU4157324.1 ATP-binding cassette domain-containing protein [Alphaproteobacteria bacterium]
MPDRNASAVMLEDVRLILGSADFQFDCRIVGGAITAVAGPSGSGKSTLLNLIAGFEQPDQGRVLIADDDVSRLSPADRPVSLVFQDNNLFAHLDLFTNVGLGIEPAMRLKPGDRLAVSEALARVGLGGYEKRLPATLSGGERQRAAFARALVRRKPVMLLDEPFAALDPGLRSAMADLLLDLHRETGHTIVIVTHDPQEVARLAADVLFLEAGRVALGASRETFFTRTDIASVADFLGKADGG